MNDYMTLVAVIDELQEIAELPTARLREALDAFIVRKETEAAYIEREMSRDADEAAMDYQFLLG
jgi:isocitrate/isopropylmalate dehydrogenase